MKSANQYMMFEFDAWMSFPNAFDMHMHMFLWNGGDTNSWDLKTVKNADFKKKRIHRLQIPISRIYLGGNYFLRMHFTTLKGQPTAGMAGFCEKVCFFWKPKISIVFDYMLMTFVVCVWPSLHLMLYMFSVVSVSIWVCVGKLFYDFDCYLLTNMCHWYVYWYVY